MRLPALRIVPHAFTAADFIGGDLAVDFVNTAAGLNRDPRDRLDGYAGLTHWAAQSGAYEAAALTTIASAALADPGGARGALARARALRETLYELFHDRRSGRALGSRACADLTAWLARSAQATDLVPADGGLARTLDAGRAGFDLVACAVADAGVSLLTSGGMELRVCEGRNCGWLFIDVSRNRRRRWCDMKTCGNAAKAHRHYQRSRRL